MYRYKLVIEFDGGRYHGFQAQATGRGVQDAIEDAIFKFCGERIRMQSAGRTDSGVHARGLVTHIDLPRQYPAKKVEGAINFYLIDKGIAILSATEVGEDFHARFSCIRRHYMYRIINRVAPLALDDGWAWRVKRPLDASAMQEGAERLVGHHDFTTFRDLQCQAKSPFKTLEYFRVERQGSEILLFTGSRSFLHRQVRSMVGTLAMVGEGKWSPDDVTRALEARDRRACGQTAPADGLYFMAADYSSPGEKPALPEDG